MARPQLVGVLTRPSGTRPQSLAHAQSTVWAGRVAPKRRSSPRLHFRGVFTRHPQPRPPKDASAQSKTAAGRAVVGCQATVPRGTPTLAKTVDTPQWNTPTKLGLRGRHLAKVTAVESLPKILRIFTIIGPELPPRPTLGFYISSPRGPTNTRPILLQRTHPGLSNYVTPGPAQPSGAEIIDPEIG